MNLRFDHAGEGLELRSYLPDGIQADPARLGGLQVFQNGQELPADQLSAHAQGDRVVLEGEAIRAGVPTQVCLATTGWYAAVSYTHLDVYKRQRYTYASCDACVVLEVDGQTVVLNGPDEASTQALYDAIQEHVSQ